MPEQLLHRPDVGARLQQVGGKGVAKGMAAHVFRDAGGARCALHSPDKVIFVYVVAPDHTGARIGGELVRGEDEFPAPFVRRVRVLAEEGVRQLHIAEAVGEIPVVQRLHANQVRLERLDHRLRQHRHAVFSAFAIAHQNLPVVEIHILYAQLQALAQAQTRPVKQARHQPPGPVKLREQSLHLGYRKYRRQPRRTFGALQTIQPRQRLVERLLVQKEQRGERLVLSRGCDIPIAHEMIEECRHLCLAQLARMARAVEMDEPLDPVHIGFLRAAAIVTARDRVAHPIQQARARGRPVRRRIIVHGPPCQGRIKPIGGVTD